MSFDISDINVWFTYSELYVFWRFNFFTYFLNPSKLLSMQNFKYCFAYKTKF